MSAIFSSVGQFWRVIQGDPVFMRRVNGGLTIFWIVMIPISIFMGWIHSVAYISALSLWALVSGHWSAWQAARVEVEQQREQREREENPPEEKVVEKLVQETTLEAVSAGHSAASAGSSAASANKSADAAEESADAAEESADAAGESADSAEDAAEDAAELGDDATRGTTAT